MKKIAVITCYFDPDYVRGKVLRTAFASLPGVKVIVSKNSRTGLLRYPEMLWKIMRLRLRDKPDAYLLTFRGQEMLPYVLLVAGGKPVWFDEFIVPIAYAKGENHRRSFAIRVKHFLARVSEPLYRSWLKHCAVILADTSAHAELSARTSNINLRNYLPVPVGSDEKLFKPAVKPAAPVDAPFQVFYYGNMLPLHGLGTVLEAAGQLKDQTDIEFLLIGGKNDMRAKITLASHNGARITYRPWVDFKDIPGLMHSCDVFLAGPYGGSPQAQNVVTGKAYQALACATPIIVGSSPADDEYFIDRQNALVVSQADAEALVRAILWAKAHPNDLLAIGQAGRKLYDKEFTNAAVARRLQPLIDGLS